MDSNAISSNQYTKSPINYGRRKIILDYDEVTPENFLEVFEKAKAIHSMNKRDCDYLIKVFLGDQNILRREGQDTTNINNKVVVNSAYPISREIVGYTFGNPIELIQKNNDKQEQVQKLSDIFSNESVYTTDICAALYGSITGISYEITLPSSEISKDNIPENPLIVDYLSPQYTFIVQSTKIGNPQIMSCIEISDSNGANKKYIAFTDKYKFTLDSVTNTLKTEKNVIEIDPITPFENMLFLTGDWEQALSVMDALNQVVSDSLNDIEGTIKSLLVLIGCEVDVTNEDVLNAIRKKRLLSIAGGVDAVSGNLDAKFISPQLESASVQNIREFLEDARNVITGIPDRSANSSGGDTGEAVLNRDGWTDIEIVAKLKELFFKKGKKKQLKVAIKILQKLNLIDSSLTAADIEPNIGRHTTDNLGTKTTAFSTLVATGELATIDCLEMSGLTTRTNEVVQRGEEFRQKRREESIEYMKEEASLNGEGYTIEDIEYNNNSDE